MANYPLLEEVGRTQKPVMLKRGMYARIDEWLGAAEYIMNQGNAQVMLCERGIRTFEIETRNTMDINAIPVLKHLSHLPVIADPSHGTGRRYLVEPVSLHPVHSLRQFSRAHGAGTDHSRSGRTVGSLAGLSCGGKRIQEGP
jgi:3-deoxy-7-phosphoheptulonate synthase